MSYTTHIDESFIVNSAAALRLLKNDKHKNVLVVLNSLTSGTIDGHGEVFVYNAASVAADDGVNVIVPTGITTGAWVRVGRNQEPITFEQYGSLTAGTFTKLLPRGGTFSSVHGILATAGSVASTVAVQINAVTVATITFAIAATVGTVVFAAGSNFTAADLAKVSFVITSGTSAAGLSVSIDA